MRANAMEELLKLFEQAVFEGCSKTTLKNLAVKSAILRDRNSNPSSVIKELMNKQVGKKKQISYKHKNDIDEECRYVQYEKDPIPDWAVDIQEWVE